MVHHEAQEQREVIKHCTNMSLYIPIYGLIFHISNEGKRSLIGGRLAKLGGIKSGVPDLMLPVARCGFHGLFIEMKSNVNKTSDKQDFWITELKEQGYKVEVCYSSFEATQVIDKYVKGIDYKPIRIQKGTNKLPF